MRKTFLEYVAEDLLKKYGIDLSRITLVFPNKRASLFLNEHLARMADGPLWSPVYTTISQLFRDRSERVWLITSNLCATSIAFMCNAQVQPKPSTTFMVGEC